jgi:hypothetical protein
LLMPLENLLSWRTKRARQRGSISTPPSKAHNASFFVVGDGRQAGIEASYGDQEILAVSGIDRATKPIAEVRIIVEKVVRGEIFLPTWRRSAGSGIHLEAGAEQLGGIFFCKSWNRAMKSGNNSSPANSGLTQLAEG